MKAAKNQKHHAACRQNGINFGPLIVEILGGWEAEASFYLKEIAKTSAGKSDKKADGVSSHFFKRLSVLLQRANSSLIASRAPPRPPPHIIGLWTLKTSKKKLN